MRNNRVLVLPFLGAFLGAGIVVVAMHAPWRRLDPPHFPTARPDPTQSITAKQPIQSTRVLGTPYTTQPVASFPPSEGSSPQPSLPNSTPQSGSQWTTVYVAAGGYTVSFPSGWVITPATTADETTESGVTTIQSWKPTSASGTDAVATGQILADISLSDRPLSHAGDPVLVTQANIVGIMTKGTGEPGDEVDPEMVREVFYETGGNQWSVVAFFGDQITDSNPNLAIFLEILKSINHVQSPMPTPLPAPTPTPTPSPTSTPTPVPLPYEYLHPDEALREAATQLGVYLDPYTASRADVLPFMYHLASANVGEFNSDPSQFYPWLVGWLREYYGKSTPAEDWQTHMFRQVDAVFHRPDSEASGALRYLGSQTGNTAYWDYVLLPAVAFRSDQLQLTLMKNQFLEIRTHYSVDELGRNPASAPPFDVYFAKSGYLEKWLPQP